MSCKSALYAVNTTAQTVTNSLIVNLGQIVRRYGNNLGLSGGNITVKGCGYYDIDASVTLEASASGTAVVSLYKDGTLVPGAVASVSTVADGIYTLNIPALIRQMCDCEDVLTLVVSGVAGSVTNASAVVEKI